MECRSCGCQNQRTLEAEIADHFPRLKDLDKRPVLVFPKLMVRADCGAAEFTVPEEDLLLPVKGETARALRGCTVPRTLPV